MGINQSSIDQDQQNQPYQELNSLEDVPGEPTLVLLKQSNTEGEKYEINIPDSDKQLEKQILFSRKNSNHKNIVRILQFDLSQKCIGCVKHYHTFTVISERIPFRLSSFPMITFPQALYIFYESLLGFSELALRQPLYYPLQQKIGITNKSEIKIWNNVVWAANKNDKERYSNNQTLFIDQLAQIIKQHIRVQQKHLFDDKVMKFRFRSFQQAKQQLKTRYFIDIQTGHFLLQEQIHRKNNKKDFITTSIPNSNRQFRSYSEGGKRIIPQQNKPKTVTYTSATPLRNNFGYQPITFEHKYNKLDTSHQLYKVSNRHPTKIISSYTQSSGKKSFQNHFIPETSRNFPAKIINFNYKQSDFPPHLPQNLPIEQPHNPTLLMSHKKNIKNVFFDTLTPQVNHLPSNFHGITDKNSPFNSNIHKSFQQRKNMSVGNRISIVPSHQPHFEELIPEIKNQTKKKVQFSYNNMRIKGRIPAFPDNQKLVQPFSLGLQLEGVMQRQNMRKIIHPGAKTEPYRASKSIKTEYTNQILRSQKKTEHKDEEQDIENFQNNKKQQKLVQDIERIQINDLDLNSPSAQKKQQTENSIPDSKKVVEEFKFYLRSSEKVSQTVSQAEFTSRNQIEGDSRCIIERWDEEQSFSHKS